MVTKNNAKLAKNRNFYQKKYILDSYVSYRINSQSTVH
jgi:hypothetical protein